MGAEPKEGKYIYCIAESNQSRSFGSLGIGARGDEVYTVCFGEIAAVVSNAPIKRYTVSRENVLAHEKAIEQVMAECPVLPVRFATVAEDEDKVKRILEKEHRRFKELLDDIRGKNELSLKAIFKEDAVYKDILEKYEDIRLLKGKIAALPPEKTHYERMKIGKMVEEALQKERQIVKEDIVDCLSPLATAAKTNDTYGELMIVNAAFLVEKEKEPEFDRQVRKLEDKYGEKVRFHYVGTLPPFNFVSLVIEMEKY